VRVCPTLEAVNLETPRAAVLRRPSRASSLGRVFGDTEDRQPVPHAQVPEWLAELCRDVEDFRTGRYPSPEYKAGSLAMKLAPDLETYRALLSGETVPRHRLDARYLHLLETWRTASTA
jgi:hypothetical protein